MKPIEWVGDAREVLGSFPREVRRDIGRALTVAQFGGKHPRAKPLKGFGGAMAIEQERVTRGSGNVFADLGFDNADEMQAEAVLAYQIFKILKRRRLSQRAAAALLGVAPADVNALMNGRHTGFSIRRLAHLLTRLGRDVEIVVRRTPRSRPRGQIHVRAA